MFNLRTHWATGSIGRTVLRSGLKYFDSSTLRAVWARLLIVIPLVAALIPPGLIAVVMYRYGLNVPFLDEWELVPRLSKALDGQLRFADLWAQHNAHRIVLPRIVLLALARATDWNIRYELAANFAAAMGSLAFLVLLIRRTVKPLAPALTPWLILTASLMTFSLSQTANWLWGIQMVMFMNALAAAFTVWALARWGQRWPGPALAILGAVAGTLSFANGLVIMALVPIGLFFAPRRHEGSARLLSVAVAAAVAVGVASFYLVGFRHKASPYYIFPFSHPVSYVHYVLVYMGSALGFHSMWAATWWGAVGIGAFAWCGIWLWRCSPAHRQALVPWFLLALYAVLSGFMTGVGRAHLGVTAALGSRYITISNLFWVSLLVVVPLAVKHYIDCPAVLPTRKLAVVTVSVLLVTLGALSYSVSGMRAKQGIQRLHKNILRGGECLLYYHWAPDTCLRILWRHDPRLPRKMARLMEELAVGLFAPSEQEWPPSLYALVTGPETEIAGWINQITVNGDSTAQVQRPADIVVSGWAVDPFAQGRVASVLIVIDGQLMGRARTGLRRPDVAKALGHKKLLRSGWTFRIASSWLSPGAHLVEAYALLKDKRRIVKLEGSRGIQVRE